LVPHDAGAYSGRARQGTAGRSRVPVPHEAAVAVAHPARGRRARRTAAEASRLRALVPVLAALFRPPEKPRPGEQVDGEAPGEAASQAVVAQEILARAGKDPVALEPGLSAAIDGAIDRTLRPRGRTSRDDELPARAVDRDLVLDAALRSGTGPERDPETRRRL